MNALLYIVLHMLLPGMMLKGSEGALLPVPLHFLYSSQQQKIVSVLYNQYEFGSTLLKVELIIQTITFDI